MQSEEYSDRSIYQSFLVLNTNGFVFAGEYPRDRDEDIAKEKIKRFIDFGISHFIDLTEEGELRPYSHLLPENVSYLRFPIKDVSAPNSVEAVKKLISEIEEYQNSGQRCYIHCWGGVGRTGTIVACYLAHIMKSSNIEEVLLDLRKSFSMMPKSKYRMTPETALQRMFIRRYIQQESRIP